jgi:SAM-dependent methyltransferase
VNNITDLLQEKSPKLNLGCGRFADPGWINIDFVSLPGVDLVIDLNNLANEKLPFPDNCIEQFSMSHVIEHIENALPLMQELYRVATPNASLLIRCPHGASDDAWEDPTHVRPIFSQSFGYFSQPFYWRADYGYRGDWQISELRLLVSDMQCHDKTNSELFALISKERNWVIEMRVTLIAVKPARECKKELQLPLNIILDRV